MRYCIDCRAEKSPKGSYCKPCGYKNRKRPSGLKYVLRVKNRAWFSKNFSPWNKGKMLGKSHPDWKGDKVSMSSLHKWVTKWKGRPSKCEECGITKGRFEWSNISGQYHRDLSDFRRLCVKCHHQYDFNLFGARKVFYG